jgi:hypothetical protein
MGVTAALAIHTQRLGVTAIHKCDYELTAALAIHTQRFGISVIINLHLERVSLLPYCWLVLKFMSPFFL